MKTRCMLFVIVASVAGFSGMASVAEGSDFRPAIVTNLTGNLTLEQDIPCGGHVTRTPAVTGGLMELTPAEGIDQSGNKLFVLNRVYVRFAGFDASGSCGPVSDSVTYTNLVVSLQRAVSLTAVPSGGGGYSFTIPKGDFLIKVVDLNDGDLEQSYKRPSQDVTGSINLTTGAFHLHVVTAQTIHFESDPFIDEDDDGTVTADVNGTIAFPDSDGDGVPDRTDTCVFGANPDQSPVPTPIAHAPAPVTLASCLDNKIGWGSGVDVCDGGPITMTNDAPTAFLPGPNTVTWTAHDSKDRTGTDTQIVTINDVTPPAVACTTTTPLGTSFVATGSDDCGVTLTLGSFVIGNGEQIKIQETGQPGVRLQNVVSGDGIRKFLVGKGQGVILATDGAGNTSTAACVYPK
jgi:hypothetical protein